MVNSGSEGSRECKCSTVFPARYSSVLPNKSPIVMSFHSLPVSHIVLCPKLLLSNVHASST